MGPAELAETVSEAREPRTKRVAAPPPRLPLFDRGLPAVSKPPAVPARALARASSLEELDGDAAESLPEADVELELHARLISMKHMGQLDQDRSVLGDFGATVVSG